MTRIFSIFFVEVAFFLSSDHFFSIHLEFYFCMWYVERCAHLHDSTEHRHTHKAIIKLFWLPELNVSPFWRLNTKTTTFSDKASIFQSDQNDVETWNGNNEKVIFIKFQLHVICLYSRCKSDMGAQTPFVLCSSDCVTIIDFFSLLFLNLNSDISW